MSGFSPEWLALREPIDHRARDQRVLGTCSEHFASHDVLHILDLGSGTGSNLRAIAPHLAPRQFWRLADHDPSLLAAARHALRLWADSAQDNGANLLLEKGGKSLHVAFCEADLSGDISPLLMHNTDLVTAAALFDLCSEPWIAQCIGALDRRKLSLYAALTYNGEESWHPPIASDADMLAAFICHQQTDKGFGKAAGPEASDCLIRELRLHGYGIAVGDSIWQLGPGDSELIAALADGSAAAAAETGQVAAARVETWRQARRAAERCAIGHSDIFACRF